jgi:NTP pyrophosphatase (non-canonical NTP hydrolase)
MEYMSKTHDEPISSWYVQWANSLDSAGKDSSAVRERLNDRNLVTNLHECMMQCIMAAKRADKLKKLLFYGKIPEYLPQYVPNDLDPTSEQIDTVMTHETIRLLHAILGKIDEAGELTQALHAHIFEGKPLDVTNIIEEVGDSRWYDALIARWAGFDTFDPIDEANYRKLTTRYPDGAWTQQQALNRNLDKEKEALDGTTDRT